MLCRHLSRLAPGVLVLTEFTGFARVLNGCLRVNPNAQTELVETLDAALSMSSEERSARAAKDLLHIQKCTIEAFAQRFVTELKATANKSADDFMCVGFGLAKVRLVGMGAEFKPLDTSEVVGTFQRARRRLLLLDWGGTLAPPSSAGAIYDSRDSQGGAALPPTVIESLTRLCAQPGCHVVIVSGLPKERVLAAFGDVPNLSLAVEHGMHYRVGSGPWQQLVTGMDDSWRSVAHSVMNVYATRTHGAFVQTKGSSMLWNFVESDPEFGYMQGRELQTTLQHVLHNFPVVVRTGNGYVEACLKEVNKGALAQRIVETLTADGEPLDFTLYAGASDERVLPNPRPHPHPRPHPGARTRTRARTLAPSPAPAPWRPHPPLAPSPGVLATTRVMSSCSPSSTRFSVRTSRRCIPSQSAASRARRTGTSTTTAR